MKRNNKKIILFLSLFLVFILFIGAVSASGDVNSGDEDVLTVDAVEKVSVASEGVAGDYLVSSGEAADALSVNNDSDLLGDASTYSELASEIGAEGDVVLKHSLYTYDDSGSTITISSANRVIDGNGAVIDMAGSNIRAFYVSGAGVTIKNLTIKNCNSAGSGGAIYVSSSSTIENCNFINNKATDTGGGNMSGAVYLNAGSVINCSFMNNTASYGGAVNIYGSGSVINCSFVHNTAYNTGGAIYMGSGPVVNCSFVHNTASYGGAVTLLYSSDSIVNCSFVHNTAYTIGGAIYTGSGCVISNCNLENNSAEGYGGAVYISYGSVVNCSFVNNAASEGGAVYIKSGSVDNCSFENNSAYNMGGAIYTGSGSVVNCSFVNNRGPHRNIYGSSTFKDNKFLDTIITLNNNVFYYGTDFTVKGTIDAGRDYIDNLTIKLNDTAVHTYALDVKSNHHNSALMLAVLI